MILLPISACGNYRARLWYRKRSRLLQGPTTVIWQPHHPNAKRRCAISASAVPALSTVSSSSARTKLRRRWRKRCTVTATVLARIPRRSATSTGYSAAPGSSLRKLLTAANSSALPASLASASSVAIARRKTAKGKGAIESPLRGLRPRATHPRIACAINFTRSDTASVSPPRLAARSCASALMRKRRSAVSRKAMKKLPRSGSALGVCAMGQQPFEKSLGKIFGIGTRLDRPPDVCQHRRAVAAT